MIEFPLEFVLSSSLNSVGDFQLRKLAESQNLKGAAMELLEQAIDKAVEARLACWLRMHREDLFRLCSSLNVPNEAELKLWLHEHGEELVRILSQKPTAQLEEKTPRRK